tara:strand:+ start:979 stop:1932 length:954 start_codon:yes stop_codon:yes gene_type:complete
LNRFFIIPVAIFFIIICVIVFYFQFIYDDWKFIAPKKILPDICNDKNDLELVIDSEDNVKGRSFKDNPDVSSKHKFHAVYLLPCEMPDRRFDVDFNIQSSLYAINRWFFIKSKKQKINFDKNNNNNIDVTFLRVNKTMNWFIKKSQSDNNIKNVGLQIENIILSNTNLFNNFNKKKFIVFFEGWEKRKSLFFNICGKSRYDGKVAVFFTNGKWKQHVGNNKKMFSCIRDDSLNDLNDETFGDSEATILHEILHTLGAPSKCATNLDPNNIFHVNDSNKDILYKYSGNIYLDYNNDDYYNHNMKDCYDLVDSNYLIKP